VLRAVPAYTCYSDVERILGISHFLSLFFKNRIQEGLVASLFGRIEQLVVVLGMLYLDYMALDVAICHVMLLTKAYF
jgi:hypothetical protein